MRYLTFVFIMLASSSALAAPEGAWVCRYKDPNQKQTVRLDFAGGGLTVATCECVRSEMKGALDAYSYDAMVLLANGRDEEAGARLGGLTERDQVAVAAVMMSAYSMCASSSGDTAR